MTVQLITIGSIAHAYLAIEPRMQMHDGTLESLHCPYKGVGSDNMYFNNRNLTAEQYLDLRTYLPLLMTDRMSHGGATMGTHALLVAMQHYGCVPAYHATEAGAQHLALAVILYVGDYRDEYPIDPFARPYICELLNTWLKPTVPWSDLPGVVTVCRHLFGDVWCSLHVADDCFDEVGAFWFTDAGIAISEIIRGGLTPFQPGLCQEYDVLRSLPLPALEGAP